MGYFDAVKSCIRKFADFRGRASRSEYWYWSLTVYVIYLMFSLWAKVRLDGQMEMLEQRLKQDVMSVDVAPTISDTVMSAEAAPMISDTMFLIIVIAIFIITWIPSLAVTVRRLHDIGKSGWYIFVSWIPIVGPVLFLIFMLTESERGDNQYGPNPHEEKKRE